MQDEAFREQQEEPQEELQEPQEAQGWGAWSEDKIKRQLRRALQKGFPDGVPEGSHGHVTPLTLPKGWEDTNDANNFFVRKAPFGWPRDRQDGKLYLEPRLRKPASQPPIPPPHPITSPHPFPFPRTGMLGEHRKRDGGLKLYFVRMADDLQDIMWAVMHTLENHHDEFVAITVFVFTPEHRGANTHIGRKREDAPYVYEHGRPPPFYASLKPLVIDDNKGNEKRGCFAVQIAIMKPERGNKYDAQIVYHPTKKLRKLKHLAEC